MKKYFPLTLFLSKLVRNIFLEKNYFTPNSITLLSFILGVIACLLFLQGTYILGIIGSLFLIDCFILDYVDGFVARKKNLKTKLGHYLDLLNDWLVSCLFFVCLGIAVSKTQNSNIFFWMGIAAGIGGTINFIRVMHFNQQSISAKKSRQHKHNKYSLWEKTLYFFREECKSDLYTSYGKDNSSDFIFKYKKEDDKLVLLINDHEFSCKIYGDYNFPNIASAISIGKILDLDNDEIQNGLNKFQTEANRSEVLEYHGNKIYLDAYNANPSSMIAALDNFNRESQNNKIIILGDMLELGSFSKDKHLKIINHLDKMDFESVYLIGEIFSSLNTSDSRFKKFNDIEELIKELDLTQIKDKSILIKGSRGIGLEKLIN